MNKICTSIEQSQKLIELGIDVNTADMMWDDWNLIDEGWKLSVGYHPGIEKDYGRKCYPAWSLSALLELLPLPTLEETLITDAETKWQCTIYCDKAKYWSELRSESINAAFEMVCWLLENKKI